MPPKRLPFKRHSLVSSESESESESSYEPKIQKKRFRAIYSSSSSDSSFTDDEVDSSSDSSFTDDEVDSSSDSSFTDDDEIDTSKETLQSILNKRKLADEKRKEHVINLWMAKIPLYKRRKLRDIATQIYDKLQDTPEQSTILTSKMSLTEKYNIMEQLEILQNMMGGTAEYFQ